MKIIGIILIIVGIAMAVTGSFSFQYKKKIIDTDIVDISKQETKTVAWPRITGAVIIGGIVLLLMEAKARDAVGRMRDLIRPKKSKLHFLYGLMHGNVK